MALEDPGWPRRCSHCEGLFFYRMLRCEDSRNPCSGSICDLCRAEHARPSCRCGLCFGTLVATRELAINLPRSGWPPSPSPGFLAEQCREAMCLARFWIFEQGNVFLAALIGVVCWLLCWFGPAARVCQVAGLVLLVSSALAEMAFPCDFASQRMLETYARPVSDAALVAAAVVWLGASAAVALGGLWRFLLGAVVAGADVYLIGLVAWWWDTRQPGPVALTKLWGRLYLRAAVTEADRRLMSAQERDVLGRVFDLR